MSEAKLKQERDRVAYEKSQATLAMCNAVAARDAERERLAHNHLRDNIMKAIGNALDEQKVVPQQKAR